MQRQWIIPLTLRKKAVGEGCSVGSFIETVPYLLGAVFLYVAYRVLSSGGIGQTVFFGGFMIYAAILSWGANNSVFWAFIHGLLGIFYVGYYYLLR